MGHEHGESADRQPVDRRSFLGTLSIALTAIVSLCGAGIAAAFSLGPALKGGGGSGDSETFSALGKSAPAASAGPELQTVRVTTNAGWAVSTEAHGVFVDTAADGSARAFSARCPHEGCTVAWRAETSKYVCPCHNSEWTREGERVTGPTKRGLDPLPVRRGADGSLEVAYKTYALDTPDRVQVG